MCHELESGSGHLFLLVRKVLAHSDVRDAIGFVEQQKGDRVEKLADFSSIL
jgi:hypothetical protein